MLMSIRRALVANHQARGVVSLVKGAALDGQQRLSVRAHDLGLFGLRSFSSTTSDGNDSREPGSNYSSRIRDAIAKKYDEMEDKMPDDEKEQRKIVKDVIQQTVVSERRDHLTQSNRTPASSSSSSSSSRSSSRYVNVDNR